MFSDMVVWAFLRISQNTFCPMEHEQCQPVKRGTKGLAILPHFNPPPCNW